MENTNLKEFPLNFFFSLITRFDDFVGKNKKRLL
jgi:hypothetical protein